MAEGQRVHVLLVAFAAQGHINPMLSFGKRLASKGLRATLATTDVAREKLIQANKTNPNSATATKSGPEVQLEFYPDGWDLDYDRHKNIDMYMEVLRRAGPQNLSQLIKTIADNGYPVSCIVNNPFTPWAVDVAEQHGIPCAMLWIQSCALYALYYRCYQGLNQFQDPTDPDFVLNLPGLPTMRREDIPTFLLPSNPFKSFPNLLVDQFQKIKKVKWVLANSFYELEREAIESMAGVHPIKTVGPLVPPALLGQDDNNDCLRGDMWKAAEDCIDWLDTQPPNSVVYVSFGSLPILSGKQMENLACGLRNSGRPFLWVVRPEEGGFAQVGGLPAGFLEDTAGQRLVVPWCPQVKVLNHPSVACFLTHCGWNSTLETVAAGLPVIAFPQWTDQPTNAKVLVDVFKMGLQMRGDGDDGTVSKEEIERCIAEITEGPKCEELKKKALEWKQAAREATMEGGSSDQNIQLFVDQLVGGEMASRSHVGDFTIEAYVSEPIK